MRTVQIESNRDIKKQIKGKNRSKQTIGVYRDKMTKRDYANELLSRVRQMSKQETINKLDVIVESIFDMINYDQIMTVPQKKFLHNAIIQIQKARYIVEISKI